MTNLIVVLLLIVLVGIVWLLYREYRRTRASKFPLYTEALIELLDGNTEVAFEKLKQTVTEDSNNVDAYLRLAELLRRRGQHERAGRIYQMLGLRRNLALRDEQKVLLALAREHLRQKRVSRAISVLEQLNELNPRGTTSRELLLALYVRNERWDDAKSLLSDLLRIQKDRQRAALYCTELGARLLTHEPENARRYLQQALRLDRNSVFALVYLADALYRQQETDEAVAKWQQAIGLRPELSPLLLQRIEKAYYESGRYEEMPRIYEEFITRHPENTAFYIALARFYAKKSEFEKARAVIGRVPAGQQKNVAVRLLAADLELSEQRIGPARTELAAVEAELTTPRFRCTVCGYTVERELHWYCPQCGSWESFRVEPVPGTTGEQSAGTPSGSRVPAATVAHSP